MNAYKVGSIIFVAGFVLFFVTSILLTLHTYQFLSNSTVTQGVITEIKTVKDPESSRSLFKPVITFTDTSGQAHVFDSSSASTNISAKIGDKVRVRYLQSDPSQVNVDSFFDNWFMVLTFGVVSMGMLFFALGFYRNTFYIEMLGRRLKLNGKKITATVTDTAHYSFGPNILNATWNDETGKSYAFRSQYLGGDPSEVFKSGSPVDVYLDPKNYSKYYVDVGNLR